jgi:hypothetical protein
MTTLGTSTFRSATILRIMFLYALRRDRVWHYRVALHYGSVVPFLYALRRDRVWALIAFMNGARSQRCFYTPCGVTVFGTGNFGGFGNVGAIVSIRLRRDRVWNPTLSGGARACGDADLLHGWLFQDRVKVAMGRLLACPGWSRTWTGDGV